MLSTGGEGVYLLMTSAVGASHVIRLICAAVSSQTAPLQDCDRTRHRANGIYTAACPSAMFMCENAVKIDCQICVFSFKVALPLDPAGGSVPTLPTSPPPRISGSAPDASKWFLHDMMSKYCSSTNFTGARPIRHGGNIPPLWEMCGCRGTE